MEKLERSPEKSYTLCSTEDMEFLEERNLMEICILKYDYEKAAIYMEALEKKVSDSIYNRQYVAHTRTTLDYLNQKIGQKEYRNRMEETLQLTMPDYKKYLESTYPYTEQEHVILMRIANVADSDEEYEESIRIYKMQLRSLEKGYMSGENIGYLKIVLIRNLSYAFTHLDNLKAAWQTIEKVLELSIKYDCGYMIPIALNDKAFLKLQCYKAGDTSITLEEIKQMKRQAYYIAASRDDSIVKNIIKATYEQEFNEQIELL